MADNSTSIEALKDVVRQFVDARDWQQFHSPKNLATSILIEGAELCEHFQWLTEEQSRALSGTLSCDSEIAEEIADVLSYALAIANVLDIDLHDALVGKMAKNAVKYPAPRRLSS